MSTAPFDQALAELHQRLDAARQRLRHAEIQRRLRQGLTPMLRMSVILAAMFVFWRSVAVPNTSLAAWFVFGGLLVVMWAGLLWAALRAGREAPDDRPTAERLDLAAADHNRIANALSLAQSQHASPFSGAAIEDGLDAVRRYESRQPYAPLIPLSGRRIALLVGAFVVLTITAIILPPRVAGVFTEIDTPAPPAGTQHTTTEVAREIPEDASQTPPAPPPTPRVASDSGESTSAAPSSDTDASATKQQPPQAAPASASGAASASANRIGGGSPSATPSSSSKKPQQKKANRPGKKPGEQKPQPTPPSAANPANASISPGGTGSGSASPVAHNASQQDASEGDDEGGEDDEPVEDEERESKQRGGLQPSLKDRNAAPSRDLGLGDSLDGPPGTGRGGPTPPKKSRGTASLVLGVPVPDFVRGQLGPGTTRIVQERVAPIAAPGAPATPNNVTPRDAREAPVSRFEVPTDLAATVRAMLLSLHAGDTQPAATAVTAEGE